RYFHVPDHHCHLPSFPTRRSSDLGVVRIGRGAVRGADPAHTSGFVKAILDSQLKAASRPKISRIMKVTNSRTVTEYRTSSRRVRSEEHTSELQSRFDLVCRRVVEK